MALLQFAARKVVKEYICLCSGPVPQEPADLTFPLKVVGGNHLSSINYLPNAGFLQTWRTDLQVLVILDTRNSA